MRFIKPQNYITIQGFSESEGASLKSSMTNIMNAIFKNVFYTIFFNQKKRLFAEKDEIKVSTWVLKNELSAEKRKAYAESVFSKIEEMKEFKNARRVLFYWSSHNDLPTYDYIMKWNETKTILLPKVRNNKIHLKKFVGIQPITEEEALNFEPKTENYEGGVDLAIIPAIAFDKNKYRMGQGKGYYCKFFKFKSVKTIGVGYDFQIIDNVPSYWRDLSVDTVITPSGTIS